jgi:protein-S-isoprenylcysteine O-methyltransferase Ste14
MKDESQHPAVQAPPPLIFGGCLAVGLFLGRGAESDARGATFARAMGIVSLAAGVALGAATVRQLKSIGSNVSPYAPATALATNGVFAMTRNPGYVAATLLYLGIALRARSLPALVMLPVALALLERLVIDPEERYLKRRFGAEYRAYRKATPRWF